MIRGEVQYEGRHAGALRALAAGMPEMDRQLARELAQATREANRIERLAGRDADGATLRPVSVRVGKYAGATGAPMVPHGEASSPISGFFVNEVKSANGYTLVAGNRSPMARVLGYHAAGKAGSGRPISRDGQVVGFRGVRGRTTGIRRNVLGIGPVGRRGIREVFARHPRRVAERLRRFASRAASFFGSL